MNDHSIPRIGWQRGALADGREIIYFDESPGSGRAARPDRRELPEVAAAVEVRRDPLLGDPVVYAAHRQDRTFLPPPEGCPLCPSAPGRPTEIPAPDYDVVVLENRFPALTGSVGGRCEVICFSSAHEAAFTDLPPRRVRTVIEAWARRTAELAARPGVAQVFCFENRGAEIGVTLTHPHGQIYAYPFVTPRTARMLRALARHARRGGGNLFDDVLAAARACPDRLVAASEHWTAFVPRAARWPYEVHLYPNVRVPDLPALPEPARADLAGIYLDLLRRFDALFGRPVPYVAAWHQAPVDPRGGSRTGAASGFALHLELFTIRRAADRLKYLAGSESAMEVWINDVTPEQAARRLRESAPPPEARDRRPPGGPVAPAGAG